MTKRKKKPEATPEADSGVPGVQRELAEARYARELAALAKRDEGARRPTGWLLSPRAVLDFVVGCGALEGSDGEVSVERKFFGDDSLVERAIITLTTSRGLMLVGEPGTAKTMLSELLSAAIGGASTLTIQGSAGTTEDQIKYGWNYALLLDRGPCDEALVPGALYSAMQRGRLLRFEEITRCPAEVQDVLVSPLSDRILQVPELDRVLQSAPGFNVIGTANTRDRGVNDMSAALKRRFNFETVYPLSDRALEIELVRREVTRRLADDGLEVRIDEAVIELLVTAFQELRAGEADEGDRIDRPSSALSTAEAIAVGTSASLHAYYYGDSVVTPADLARHMVGTALKDDPEDLERLRDYFSRIVRRRADESELWRAFFVARKHL